MGLMNTCHVIFSIFFSIELLRRRFDTVQRYDGFLQTMTHTQKKSHVSRGNTKKKSEVRPKEGDPGTNPARREILEQNIKGDRREAITKNSNIVAHASCRSTPQNSKRPRGG